MSLIWIILTSLILSLPIAKGWTSEVSSPADYAIKFLRDEYTKNGFQNHDAGVGSYGFYILTQAGVDVSGWVYNGESLKDAVTNAVYSDISNSSQIRAKVLAQDLVAAQSLGRNDLVDSLVQILKARQTGYGFDTGDYSIFSNMPAFDLLGRAGLISVINKVYAKDYILGTQNTKVGDRGYGAWGFTWEGNFYADFMTTAQAVRALHYLDPAGQDSQIQTAINNGLNWMKNQQKDDGSFVAGMDDPVIDTAEVIVTLKVLGLDPAEWKSSTGKTAIDYLMNKALNPDGSFGTSQNAMDATWALSAYNLLNTQFYIDPSVVTFNDISSHWAKNDIEFMAKRLIARGISRDLFAPDASITRAQFVAFLIRSLNIDEQKSGAEVFSDVPAGYWAYGAIQAAYKEGLVRGVGNGKYEPERSITREEMAAMIARALSKKGFEIKLTEQQKKEVYSKYTDSDHVSGWAKDVLAACAELGLIKGRPGNSLAPQDEATRAEAIVILRRMLEVLKRG
ncbi:S-layer homology domain-containing protein [Thermanaeromonas toyohensis ToBE]|uniref:S-layer homology domain-containing protein n=1 Tax=Thermanaeromonas toyohensis ToBE TaxID=698762 RepID=A0A1W1VIR5_9FIRM|nr:S-layer homology domain-containing protein [Thermanaeromonas toyohensis]SMB93216.1 S-layer homology domain-containing protein [Thermanaeromonas toyohensis ToBE]